ncbi:OmpA family protein [Bosea sp. WAO]|uniref:OmpA family protein n=1 Tax=Bosea sp. WAO TaxID=406341 RepID=UPI000835AB26|nr:OmpA family protein [Bosea sp. WAO]
MSDTADASRKIVRIAGYGAALTAGVLLVAALTLWLLDLFFPVPVPQTVPPPAALLHPSEAPALTSQSTPVRSLAPASAPRPNQLQGIRAELAAEIAGGLLTVDRFGGFVAIRIAGPLSFEPGRADLLPGFATLGQRLAAILEREPGIVRVVGHTDDRAPPRGSKFKDNQALSAARAVAVADWLRKGLSDKTRLGADGRGGSEPIAANTTADGRARNQRVEVLVTRSQ